MNTRKVISSFAYKFIERIAAKSIGLVIGVVLARLLSTETFGLLAIIVVFVNLAQSFVYSGLGIALVQNKTTEEEDYSTVFWFSLGMAAVFCGILWITAPLISRFYGYEELSWPLRVMSLALPVSALSSVQNAKLQREMQFKKTMYCNLTAAVLAGAIGIAAAYAGFELWALVIYNLSSGALSAMILLLIGEWHPHRIFSFQRVKVFWSYGWKLLVSGLLCSLYNDIRSLIVAKRFTVSDLAVYDKGKQYPEVIATTMDNAIQVVMLPVMSEQQDEKERMKAMMLTSQGMSMFVGTPLMLGMAAVAQTLILLLLTEKWAASIPYMVLFCISYVLIPMQMSNLNLIKAMGRSDLYMKLETVRRIVMIAILAFTILCFHSVYAIAVSFVFSSVVDTLIIMLAIRRIIGLRLCQQGRVVWKTLLSGTIMALAVSAMNALTLPLIWKLLLQILSGAVIYFICAVCLKAEPLLYAMDMLKKLKNRQQ